MAAGSTYTPIATTTIGSNAVVEFANIPNTYTDLRLVLNGGITNDYWDFRFRFNSDTAANYSQTAMNGDGTTISHSRTNSATKITTATAMRSGNLNSNMIIDILNYSNPSRYKVCLIRANSPESYGTSIVFGQWRSNTAINTIYIYAGASNDGIAHLLAGTTVTLYGITAA